MCAIAGIVSFNGSLERDAVMALDEMCNALEHRGPDGSGRWQSDCGRVALAHRRLAIIDPGPGGAQPMTSHSGRYVTSYNGEIYNFRELRGELEALGHRFRTESDTEVLLSAYSEWGRDCFSRLRGMFALALFDKETGTMTLARDPMGIKPLYVCETNGKLRFASEISALVTDAEVSQEISTAGVAGFLMFGSIPEPFTIYRDVRLLNAGDVVEYSEAGRNVHSCGVWLDEWAQVPAICNTVGPVEAQEVVQSSVRDSVAAHLVSDVPVGVFLSSGIDSCAVAAIAREHNEDVQAITLRFEDFAGSAEDEGPLAARFAKDIGITQREVRLTDHEMNACVSTILDDMDQPSIDGFNTWFVSRAAADQGLKVVLSGVGGDELFGGYPSFSRVPAWRRRASRIGRVPGAATVMRGMLQVAARAGLVSPKAVTLARPALSVHDAWLAQRALFLPTEISALMGADAAADGLEQLAEWIAPHNGNPIENEYLAIASLESTRYLRNQLLRDADWSSMAHSLELRTPLVDERLFRTVGPVAAGVADRYPHKSLLAGAPSNPLPDYITQRAKTGFVVPMEDWLRNFDALSGWQSVPSLSGEGVHWARRLAVSLLRDSTPSALASRGVS